MGVLLRFIYHLVWLVLFSVPKVTALFDNHCTGWSIWSRSTVCWYLIKMSASVETFYTIAQLLFQCQQKVVNDQIDHPVLRSYRSKPCHVKPHPPPLCPRCPQSLTWWPALETSLVQMATHPPPLLNRTGRGHRRRRQHRGSEFCKSGDAWLS